MDINQFILDGNLARAPEVRYTPSGMPVCTFTVASHSVTGSGDERREATAFIPVTTVGKLAEISGRNLRKGAGVTVIGRLGSWFDAEARKGGFTFEAHQVIFRQRAPRAAPADAPAGESASQAQAPKAPKAPDNSGPDQRWVQEFEAASEPLARAH